jgi:hypothetical protein
MAWSIVGWFVEIKFTQPWRRDGAPSMWESRRRGSAQQKAAAAAGCTSSSHDTKARLSARRQAWDTPPLHAPSSAPGSVSSSCMNANVSDFVVE